VSTADWLQRNAGNAAVALLDLAGRGAAEDAGDSILLPAEEVARLDATVAAAVGLPPPAPIILSMTGRGLVVDDSFGIDWRWVRANGTPVLATVTGARARMDGREFRLPEPLFSLQRMAQRVNEQPDLPSKQAAFAELRRLLEGHVELAITDGILEETRVAYAGHFSLALRTSGQGIDFDPVLFAPRVGEAAAEGAPIDEEADNLLTPAQQEAFARLFRRRRGQAPSYLLPDGLLLFMDPQLGEVLRVVGEKQSAPSEVRRRFAVAPRRSLAEALGSDADSFEALFVETAQYSERVTGIDPWRKPVLPWIKPKPDSWLPERIGIAIGDQPDREIIELPNDGPANAAAQAQAAVAAIEAAIEAGKEEVEVFGKRVPATTATLEAVRTLAAVTRAAAAAGEKGPKDARPPAEVRDKLFLRVRENFEELDYAPLAEAVAVDVPPPPVPETVRTTLKPHQVEGFQWLVRAWRSHRPGVLLADDMGLGKTLQALAFFSWLRAAERIGEPILVVAPTGLLANWQQEIDRHLAPDALGAIVRAYGSGLASLRQGPGTDIATGGPRLGVAPWRRAGMVLTTYETLRDYHMSFAQVGFSVVAFDEAQRIKNPSAQVTRAAKTLRARLSVALTGTPVENRLHDLWSIADVVHPGLLGTSKAFEQSFGAAGVERLRELNTRLTAAEAKWPAFMLRRMKSNHVEGLPRKVIVERAKPMPPAQAKAYADAVNRALVLRSTMGRESMLSTLAALRSISLAPGKPQVGDGFEANSARLLATFEILSETHARREKALIFCESLELQPLLAAEIRRRFRLPCPVSCISGDVAGDIRQQLVDRFQAGGPGFDVMILSPRAGGVGLTLTAANHVIHLSRWWNPAVEDQATDRVYRIGQDKDVHIWLPIAEHPIYGESSFDRKLDALMRRKRDLAAGLLVEPESATDAEQLFDEVLVGASVEETPELATEPAGPLPQTVAHAAHPSQAAPEVLTNRRHVKQTGSPVPWQIFTEALAGRTVRKLEVVDPYAAGSEAACRSLAGFLAGLRERQVTIESADLLCYDNGSLPEFRFASEAEQRAALAQAIRHHRLEDLRLYPRFISKRERKLHDRSVKAMLADGNVILWDVGGGIDYLFNRQRECVVARWINPALGS
jgi:superfamily II DNA or RNA helicase